MKNEIMYLKNMKKAIADELLNKKRPFAEISEKTGWTIQEVIDYVDREYRIKYPQYYSENKKYFCWGEIPTQKTR